MQVEPFFNAQGTRLEITPQRKERPWLSLTHKLYFHTKALLQNMKNIIKGELTI
jgi:hypothetical protein